VKRVLSCLVLLALPAAACGHSSGSSAPSGPPAPTGAPRTDPNAVHVDGRAFRDGQGRQLLFRGYNGKATGLFDVTFDDGRTANETFNDFDEAAATRFEQLGFNVLRLPVSWSGLEPKPLAYSQPFFDKLAQVLALARAHHFYVFIDMHQDAYSKEIGEDGQPLWAIVPAPPKLLSGPSDDSRRLTGPVLSAGYNFFSNLAATDGRLLQDAFVAAVQQIVKHVALDPVVLGYEAFNEPVVLHQDYLDAFHGSLADGIHDIDRDAPLLFEPIATRNQFDEATIPDAPFAHMPGVYAPHIYTAQFSVPDQHGWASEDPTVLAPSMTAANKEATAWGTPLFVTEFGCDQSTDRGAKWISAELDLQDQWLASSTVWEFSGRGSWGFYASGNTEHPLTSKVVSRTFPRAVAGDLVAIERPGPGHMLVRWRETDKTRGLPHEVSMSSDYATGYKVLCDGAPVTFTAATGRATFTCPEKAGDRTFEVIGTPVP
jgi:endoglycosylceramidase